ncbi:MAG: hypothetical protein IJD91_09640 [Clostridia bacterium]|nr:hypothetical protein [Clostridia bacterium]
MTMTLIMMLGSATILIYALLVSINGFIPKRGRCIDVDGDEIIATITNTNKKADKPSTIKAIDESGRKYAAKLRPTEAKLWIKGDKIKITLTKDKKNYRIHFHEYFRENEERIREEALSRLEKTVKFYFIAAKMTNYKKESLEALRASKADAHTIFAFTTYMSSIDKYFIIAVVSAILFVLFFMEEKLQMFELLIPLIIVIVMFLSVSATAKLCTKIYEKATKQG